MRRKLKEKLCESTTFGLNDPEKLQNKGFFEVMLYRRRKQNLRQLKKTDFSVNTNSAAAHYVCKAKDELKKKTAGKIMKVSMQV